ncbi:hypothetical protein AB4G91_08170 [Macrococcoides goetzii]|nr:hypothetical protein [Macrococcus sp. PK]
MRMEGLVNITPGIPTNRIRNDDGDNKYHLYGNETFLDDKAMFYTENKPEKFIMANKKTKLITTESEDIILNMATSEAAIVMPEHAGYALPYNYSKLTLNTQLIDKDFLVFWINESPQFAQQIKSNNASSKHNLRRITVRMFNELKIELPDIEDQKKAGLLYKSLIELSSQTRKKTELMSKIIGQKVFLEVKNSDDEQRNDEA